MKYLSLSKSSVKPETQQFGDEDGIHMATPTFGKVDEFDGNKEEWTQYVERLGFFFDANGITGAEKK